jgi:hypothetical protein
MIKNILVRPWIVESITDIEYDLIITTVGYERRSRYIAQNYNPNGKQKIASTFSENKLLDFEDNLRWYSRSNYETPEHSDSEFEKWSSQIASSISRGNNGERRILIDISSMSRYRISALLYSLATSPGGNNLSIDFAYALAKHSPPPKNTGPITSRGPVLPELAGWAENPGLPISLLIGLGYDLGKSMSSIEYIEPGATWALFPIGEDVKYEKSVFQANQIFLESIEDNKIIKYEVVNCYETFQRIKSLVAGITGTSKPIIIPLGPKIFSLISLLIALLEYPKVSVWRVSSGKYEKVANRIASGTVVGLRVDFLSH